MTSEDIKTALEKLRIQGKVATYSVSERDRRPEVSLSVIGPVSDDTAKLIHRLRNENIATNEEHQSESFYLLGGELRPGTGIIRRAGGRPDGPSGTLTCFLSSKDSQDLYFVAAGHVVTSFWTVAPPDYAGSIYISRKGFPGTNSMRSLGTLEYRSNPPRRLFPEQEKKVKQDSERDIAIVRLKGKFDLRQRTTCYGTFGEWPSDPENPKINDPVMKCGAEETHWTSAVVENNNWSGLVYGPDKTVYEFKNQMILALPPKKTPKNMSAQQSTGPSRQKGLRQQDQAIVQEEESDESPKTLPDNISGTPFAVAGDSGTMVVHQESRRPVGMLIAGSILEGKYVMTPISAIWKYWKERNFVLLRA